MPRFSPTAHRPVATAAFPKSQTAGADARFATQSTASAAKPVDEAQVAHPDAWIASAKGHAGQPDTDPCPRA
ncbi:hypothetical protein D8674_011744 [Pyrus ussuriensis x Pyrus communis]|uniref:Uncharacterized protein n=1 Tax=Pyrus ussuriensis x Pyrus communis TaxID=2448454 RepID=A0A5N5FZQ0_9ROSA|nr:hypothetical protein D8674_011744 [Pyrus ussuriensis x Pyrus communis]